MESLPLIPKSNIVPNLDVTSLIREVFQSEFETNVPSKKLSENLKRNFDFKSLNEDGSEKESYHSVEYLENIGKDRYDLIGYAENIFEAYKRHENSLQQLTEAELNILQTQAKYLKREKFIQSNEPILELLKLKRQPLFQDLNPNLVKNYKLLQGEAGLPPKHEAKLDFRVKDHKKWKKRLESVSQDSLINGFLNKSATKLPKIDEKKKYLELKTGAKLKKIKKARPKHGKREKVPKTPEIFTSDPKILFFSGFKPGEIYETKILVKNVSSMPIKFKLKPMSFGSVFKVSFYDTETTRLLPGLTFKLRVLFHPQNLDDIIEDIVLSLQDGTEIKIPLVAYLEPPLLKTDNDLDENPKSAALKIDGSYVECGNCFAGDSKVVQLRFYSYGGAGEFCILSSEDWRTNTIQNISVDNVVEMPPFRVYPAYFEIREDEMIDLNIEFHPQESGTHVENVIIACNNGESRILDFLGDGIGWHSYYFTIQDTLLKDFPVDIDDDLKVQYYLNMGETIFTNKLTRYFSISNNSNMPFEYRWEMRDADISSNGGKGYLKLRKNDVTIEPSSGVIQPESIKNFVVGCQFVNAEIGSYRSVLSLYVVNLPSQTIEEANTIIRPTMHRTRFLSQSCEEEEEGTLTSPGLSMQGTYESLRDSLKSNTESQVFNVTEDKSSPTKLTGPNRSLKKSKTYITLGESFEDGWCCLSKSKESTQYDEYGCPIPMFDTDCCGINVKGSKIIDFENEHLWDYVDVLVDEIELWVEVTPIKVAIFPPVLQICQKLKMGQTSASQSITISNFNSTSISCQWSKNLSREKINDPDSHSNRTRSTNNSENYDLAQISDCASTSEIENLRHRFSHIEVIPSHRFKVSAHSEIICEIRVTSEYPGPIQDVIYLTINDGGLQLELPIKAVVCDREFSVTPSHLDFGIVKSGSRYKKDYVITNDSPQEIYWNAKEFIFDFGEGKLKEMNGNTEEKHVKCDNGVLCHQGSFYTECYEINGKNPYLHSSLIKIQLNQSSNVAKPPERFVLITADVKSPSVSVVAPRFENAILAPPGMMFVGEKVTKTVTLKSLKKIGTEFVWGHPFGCHSKNLKIEIHPNEGNIEGLGRREIQIDITPVEEGITDHFYVPCFVNKNREPIILSIVGIAKNLAVTFEILEGEDNALTSLRIPWPSRNYDLLLGLTHLPEEDILDMRCKCTEVEEEIKTAENPCADLYEELKEKIVELEELEDIRSVITTLTKDEDSPEEAKLRQGSIVTTQTKYDESLEAKLSSDKPKQNKIVLPMLEEEEEGEEPNLKKLISNVPSIERRLDFAPDTIMEYPLRDLSIDFMSMVKSEIEFLNVPCRTLVQKQFVIRNETPITTKYGIAVKYFGEYITAPKKSVLDIKNRVMNETKGETWQDKLMEGQPLMISVTPKEGRLGKYDALPITISVYGDTWGEYRDFVICQIQGLTDFYLKVFVQIVGHPVHFPMFCNNLPDIPVLRFDYIRYKSEPVTRKIRVANRSSIPITVTWMTFLKYPLDLADEKEDPFSIAIDMFTNRDSGEESSESSKVYITKNTAEKAPSFIMTSPNLTETQLSGVTENSDPLKDEVSIEKSKSLSPTDAISHVPSKTRTEIQILENYGKFDVTIFQVNPKEMDIKPHGEQKLFVTFNPNGYKQTETRQDFHGILTGCVRLKKEYETFNDIYFRPCGKNFVSQLLNFTATVEVPMLFFDIQKGELKYKINANDVLKTPTNEYSITRKFLITNNSQSAANIKIVPQPGENFRIGLVNTVHKLFTTYDPEYHTVEVEPGQSFEMELVCFVTIDDVSRAYEILEPEGRIKRSRDLLSYCSLGSEEMSYPEILKLSEERDVILEVELSKTKSSKGLLIKEKSRATIRGLSKGASHREPSRGKSLAEVKDSLMVFNKSKTSNLRQASIMDGSGNVGVQKEEDGEKCGILPDESLPYKEAVFSEEISFQQLGLEQTITAKLLLWFPKIWSSASLVDFGAVFVKNSSVRHVSLTNTSGFLIDFKIEQKGDEEIFKISPVNGLLPHTNCEVGVTITIEFTPDEPGLFKETFNIYSNPEMKFDTFELNVIGVGTWDENHKVLPDS